MTTILAPVRAFIAIELPTDVREMLSDTQARLADRLGIHERTLRWAKPEGLHLTLQFLGDVPVRIVELVKRAMDQACNGISTFKLETGEPGVFPNERRARVIWTGVVGDLDRLNSLAKSVHRELNTLGYRPDMSFSPHLTLARVRGDAGDEARKTITDALTHLQQNPPAQVSFDVASISLMRSELRQGGSIYTRLHLSELK